MLRRQGACGHLKFPWKPKMQCLQVEQLQPFQNRVWISVPSLALPGGAHCPPGPSFDQRCPKLWWNKPGWFFFSKPLPDATLSPSLCQGLTRHVHDWRNRHQAMHCKKEQRLNSFIMDMLVGILCWEAATGNLHSHSKHNPTCHMKTKNSWAQGPPTTKHVTWIPKTLEPKVYHITPPILAEKLANNYGHKNSVGNPKLFGQQVAWHWHSKCYSVCKCYLSFKYYLGCKCYLGSKNDSDSKTCYLDSKCYLDPDVI